ncbi:MAG: HTH domain-containing protein [Thermoflexales bacterium]|nr:HTH domain-containing protein [Thermoflexales bacterium]
MSRVGNKADRLLQIEAMLLAYPEGLTQAEIARKLDVHRSIVHRDLGDLPRHIYIDDLDGGKLKVDREAYLINVLTWQWKCRPEQVSRTIDTARIAHRCFARPALLMAWHASRPLLPRVARVSSRLSTVCRRFMSCPAGAHCLKA